MINCSIVQPASGPANPDGIIEIAWIHVGPISLNIIRPVSYTHLRAHETVLDLVCRLLLEKKKTKIKNYCKYLTPYTQQEQ